MIDPAQTSVPYPHSVRAARPSRIINAGRTDMARKTERYEIPGRGAALIPIREGDQLLLSNAEGMQTVERIALDPDGQSCPSLFQSQPHRVSRGGMESLRTAAGQRRCTFVRT